MLNINDVVLEGVIVHKFATDKVAILTIGTGKATPAPNFPKVVFFGDIIKNIQQNFEIGDHIRATGNIQSSRKDASIKNQNTVSIFGESVQHSKPTGTAEDGETLVYAVENHFTVSGMVTHVQQAFDNLVRVRVSTRKNGRQSYVNAMCYTDHPEEILNKFKGGDFVRIDGTVQTTKKLSNGEPRFFENYVISKIEFENP